MARPRKKVDGDLVHSLAKIMCTMEEISTICEVSVDTLERRFAELIKAGRKEGQASLRRQQYELAMKGHPTMLIWLGKNYLGQSDKIDTVQTGQVNHTVQIGEKHRELVDRIRSMVQEIEQCPTSTLQPSLPPLPH